MQDDVRRIRVTRINLFNIITQYKATFPDEDKMATSTHIQIPLEAVIDAEIEINNNNNNAMNADTENANEDSKRENGNEINPETTSSKQVLLPINAPNDWPKISKTTSHRPCKLEEKCQ
uniref:Uncharacterized protein n=1 Tax=Glossina austeni TaxID=7395 RepID=A0A1A9VXS6_GLOAU